MVVFYCCIDAVSSIRGFPWTIFIPVVALLPRCSLLLVLVAIRAFGGMIFVCVDHSLIRPHLLSSLVSVLVSVIVVGGWWLVVAVVPGTRQKINQPSPSALPFCWQQNMLLSVLQHAFLIFCKESVSHGYRQSVSTVFFRITIRWRVQVTRRSSTAMQTSSSMDPITDLELTMDPACPDLCYSSPSLLLMIETFLTTLPLLGPPFLVITASSDWWSGTILRCSPCKKLGLFKRTSNWSCDGQARRETISRWLSIGLIPRHKVPSVATKDEYYLDKDLSTLTFIEVREGFHKNWERNIKDNKEIADEPLDQSHFSARVAAWNRPRPSIQGCNYCTGKEAR